MSRFNAVLFATALVSSVFFAACSLKKSDEAAATTTSSTSTRSYNATASVGDFISISINPGASTISYSNTSTGESGTLPYTVNTDGSYAITDPQGHLVTAWEIPGFALVASSNRTGTNNEPSLITAITSATITTDDLKNKNYNYMQFRTNNGGMEVGWASGTSNGSIDHQSYWPFGTLSGQQDFSDVTEIDANYMSEINNQTALRIADPGSPAGIYDYLFRTTGGFLAVDTPNGGLVCVEQTATKNFDPANAGTYNAIVYIKNTAQMDYTGGGNGVETGTPTLGKGTITITSGGYITVVTSDGTTIASNSLLTPVEDHSWLYDGLPLGTTTVLGNPCHGMFTFQIIDPGTSATQYVFVTFLDRAMLMASFTDLNNGGQDAHHSFYYSYFNGVALKSTTTPAPHANN